VRHQNDDECHRAEDNTNRFSITWKVRKEGFFSLSFLFKMELRFQLHFMVSTFCEIKRCVYIACWMAGRVLMNFIKFYLQDLA